MFAWSELLADLTTIVLLIVGIAMFRKPRSARAGNGIAALAMLLAMVLVFWRHELIGIEYVVLGLLLGGAVGAFIALRVTMIQIPAMVAFQHGAGGVAVFSVALVELTRKTAEVGIVGEISGLLGLVIGAATFSGSMLASAKLAAKLRQTPTVLPAHNLILLGLLLAIIGMATLSAFVATGLQLVLLLVTLLASCVLGVVFAIRIGGADMPVLISFLNATAGLAAAFCGVVIQNRLLVACGATVAASGSILTAIMCKGMNRSLLKVFLGSGPAKGHTKAPQAVPQAPQVERSAETLEQKLGRARGFLAAAKKIIVVPGYGMALAQAQFHVAGLAKKLQQQGKDVSFAVHPVAGRMPGHMNVLLAEADVDYELLKEMEQVNPEFSSTDVVLVVGACDVVNPAAIRVEGTPISGMPILNAHEARNIIVCNLDERPGYSGVPNPLYDEAKTIMLLGDAAKTVKELAGEA